jgi:hypothetical protein
MRAPDKTTPDGEPGTGVETRGRWRIVDGDGERWDGKQGVGEGGGGGGGDDGREGGGGGSGDDGREGSDGGGGDSAIFDARTGDDDRECGIVGGGEGSDEPDNVDVEAPGRASDVGVNSRAIWRARAC